MALRHHDISPPSPCEYLPGRVCQLEFIVGRLTIPEYSARLEGGWRRFGHTMFRPACPSCRMCQSLRVPVSTFRASRSQRRAWNANAGAVRIVIGTPSASADRQDLYERFHRVQSESKGWPLPDPNGIDTFLSNPFPTEEWCYYLGERLLAVGYVDVMPQGLSAVYFFYDPDERHRSLGTLNVLAVLDAARERHLPHVYLGYHVEGCRSLEYKAKFKPNEILGPDGAWTAFVS